MASSYLTGHVSNMPTTLGKHAIALTGKWLAYDGFKRRNGENRTGGILRWAELFVKPDDLPCHHGTQTRCRVNFGIRPTGHRAG
jgi:hypothetical protein